MSVVHEQRLLDELRSGPKLGRVLCASVFGRSSPGTRVAMYNRLAKLVDMGLVEWEIVREQSNGVTVEQRLYKLKENVCLKGLP